MNHKFFRMLSSSTLGASFIFFVAYFMGRDGATVEGAATLLLASIVGFGVTRFYQVTEHMVSVASDGCSSERSERKLSDFVSKG